eukprot:1321062-Amorphochlora_amoeboformis.AAC.1
MREREREKARKSKYPRPAISDILDPADRKPLIIRLGLDYMRPPMARIKPYGMVKQKAYCY